MSTLQDTHIKEGTLAEHGLGGPPDLKSLVRGPLGLCGLRDLCLPRAGSPTDSSIKGMGGLNGHWGSLPDLTYEEELRGRALPVGHSLRLAGLNCRVQNQRCKISWPSENHFPIR